MSEPETDITGLQETQGQKAMFPIIAIGASAGGLEALEVLFDNMPPRMGAAFVIIQHISPRGKSMLGEILKKHTPMSILDISDGMRVEPDHIYLNPPGRDVSLYESIFMLEESELIGGLRLPINHFFRSLARDRGEGAICIILSGTGSDGTLGLKAIKEAAGMAMAQDTTQAKYGGMPASAVSTGLVDYILPVEKMPKVLGDYITHPYLQRQKRVEGRERQLMGHVQKILALIRSVTGSDFSGYKPKTVRRRIERRMALHKIESISDYYRFVQETPREAKLLSQELLIGVTRFFRDPSAFEALRNRVIPSIMERKDDGFPVRIWVPGCSTGEEALSLAMLFYEAMDETGKRVDIQIFATDLDSDAIERARKAEYPESVASDVSGERLKRFFIKKNGIYRVKTSLREMIVYATQNLASDPPFSRLDLISCRNLLIYMDSALQKKIIPLFHYTLNPDGYLFLGSSESIGNFSSLFSVLDSKSKIFKVKKDSGKMRTMEFAGTEVTSGSDLGRMEEKLGKENAAGAMEKLIVSEYAPAAILIDHKYDILYLRGPTNKFLEFTGGQASLNLLRLANPGIAHKLPSALREAQSSRVPVTIPNVQVRQNGQIRTIDINIRPLSDKGEDPDLLVVVFVEVLSPRSVGPRKRKTPHSEETHPRVVELENELQATKKDLEATIEELEAANEELKSSNEELQSINEETQSTNEELATAREELQSTNEELVTVNSELQSKVEELSEINDDISNLFASTDIGTVFLDNNLRIKRFTPAMKRLFNLIPADMGRSLRDIAPKVYLGSILDDAERVLETLQMSEKEIETARKWFLTRILPYRTRDDLIAGVVITFVDVTEIKRFEREMAKAKIYAESIVNTIREPLLILDGDLRVVSANRSFYRFFVSSAVETVGKLIYDLGNGQWNIPELRRLLEEILPENSTFDGFEVEHEFPVIGYRKMLLNARRMQLESDGPGLILLVLEGSTESARVCRQAPGLSEEDIGR